MNSTHQNHDLIWAVNSPSLISNAGHHERLDSCDVNPEHLASFLEDFKGHRVGRYFEQLIFYWLKYIRRVEIIAQSLPIRDGNRTLGEIDLLFRDEQGRLTHWEIALKFYLHFPHPSLIDSHFIGPNATDTFERKMERLFQHQLPRSEATFPDIEIREAYVKGRIFYHPLTPPIETFPEHLSADHLRCHWIRSSQLDLIIPSNGERFRVLDKPCWLSEEIAVQRDNNLLSWHQLAEQLEPHFAKGGHPVLISKLRSVDQKFVESQRTFVVPQHWPGSVDGLTPSVTKAKEN